MSLTNDIIAKLPKDNRAIILMDRQGFDVWSITNIGRDGKTVYCLSQYPVQKFSDEVEIFFDEIIPAENDYGNLFFQRDGYVVAKISGIKSYKVVE